MFKFVVVLAFVAACSATYNVGQSKTYLVDVGKDYIKVANDYGKYVLFKVDKYFGYEAPQNIFVEYHGERTTPMVVRFFDRKVAAEGIYQTEILYKLFNEYNGQIDALQYEKILDIIRQYVENDTIYPAVLYALKALYGDEKALTYLYQESYQTPYNRLGFYGKGYRYSEYEQETPYDRLATYFGKNYGYGDYNRNYYNRELSHQGVDSYYPQQFVAGKGIYGNNYGPYNSEYQHFGRQETPYKNWDVLFAKSGYGYDKTYNYPTKYGYSQESYGPYNREYQQFQGQSGYGYPQKYYGQYPKYGYGKTYGVEYPQQYQGLYSQQYYGPYASQYTNLFHGYGSNMQYQKPYYF